MASKVLTRPVADFNLLLDGDWGGRNVGARDRDGADYSGDRSLRPMKDQQEKGPA